MQAKTRYESSHSDRCDQCGAPVALEMDGLWSYRICMRNGHVQPRGAGEGPLGHAVMLFATRGQ